MISRKGNPESEALGKVNPAAAGIIRACPAFVFPPNGPVREADSDARPGQVPEPERDVDERGRAPPARSSGAGAAAAQPRVHDRSALRRTRMHHQDLDLQPVELLRGPRAAALLRGSRPQEGRASGRLIPPSVATGGGNWAPCVGTLFGTL